TRPQMTASHGGSGTLTVTVLPGFTDNFNRADGPLDTSNANWVALDTIPPQIVGGELWPTATGTLGALTNHAARWVDPLLTDRQEVSATYLIPPGDNPLTNGVSIFLRGTTTGSLRVEAIVNAT